MKPEYKDHEKEFLNDMVMHFGFAGNTELAFVERLLTANSDAGWETLADALQDNLQRGARNPDANVSKILTDRWDKNICPQLAQLAEKDGYEFSGKGKWTHVRAWLHAVKFPEWCKEKGLIPPPPPPTPELFWKQLWKSAIPTDKIEVVIVGSQAIPTLGIWNPTPTPKLTSVPLESKIFFKINLDNPGYLLFIEKSTSDDIWCLCPSFLASQDYFAPGEIVFPASTSEHKYFHVEGETGIEENLVLLSQNQPSFNWLPRLEGEPVQLEMEQLQDLLGYVDENRDCQVMRMQYRVTA